MSERDWQDAMWSCERWLAGRRPAAAAELLRAAAESLPADARPDQYGEGELVEGFERRVTELLGMPDGVLMPSGTMAQQIALRIHCDLRATGTVGFHPTCHLELHEHGGYAHLHGLKAELIGHRDRLIELSDLEALPLPLGALLLPPFAPPDRTALLVQAEDTQKLEALLADVPRGRRDLAVLPEYAYTLPPSFALKSPNGPASLARKLSCPVVFGAVEVKTSAGTDDGGSSGGWNVVKNQNQ